MGFIDCLLAVGWSLTTAWGQMPSKATRSTESAPEGVRRAETPWHSILTPPLQALAKLFELVCSSVKWE